MMAFLFNILAAALAAAGGLVALLFLFYMYLFWPRI